MSKINIYIFKSKKQASYHLAKKINSFIQKKLHSHIGLASGVTFLDIYKALGNLAKKQHTSWNKVKTYNLDEFVGASSKVKHSCYLFMKHNLFKGVKIPLKNTNFPPSAEITSDKELKSYDAKVKNAKCDIQLLGLGVNGHIGFNEPYELNMGASSINSLSLTTIQTKADYFYNGDVLKMSDRVVTVGINTILELNNVVLCAFGESKAQAVEKLIGNSKITDLWPVQYLRSLPELAVIIDKKCFDSIKGALNVENISIHMMKKIRCS